MAAILTSNASVMAAENFITSIYENETNLYMGVGQGFRDNDTSGDHTPDNDDVLKWNDEYNPPTPTDKLSSIEGFLSNLIGIKKVHPSNIMLVVPRNNWAAGKIYNPLQPEAISAKRAQDYYCLTTDERGNNCVWICLKKEITGNMDGTTKYEPTLQYMENPATPPHTDAGEDIGYHYITNNIVKCADGYTWMFLYNITSTVINAGLMLDNWMPVPFNHHGLDNIAVDNDHPSGASIQYGGTLTDTQITYGDCNANRTLGAYRILVTCTLADEGSAIPYSCIYRQVGLLLDPRSSSLPSGTGSINYPAGDTSDTSGNNAYGVTNTYSIYPQTVQGVRLKGERYPATEVDTRYSSAEDMMGNPVQVIYLENKKPMMREESQSEKLEIILVF